MPTLTPGQEFKFEQRQDVRKAWRRGRKTIVIDGTKCSITKAKRHTTKRMSKEGVIETITGKQYLLVRPVDRKKLTPVIQVLQNEKD